MVQNLVQFWCLRDVFFFVSAFNYFFCTFSCMLWKPRASSLAIFGFGQQRLSTAGKNQNVLDYFRGEDPAVLSERILSWEHQVNISHPFFVCFFLTRLDLSSALTRLRNATFVKFQKEGKKRKEVQRRESNWRCHCALCKLEKLRSTAACCSWRWVPFLPSRVATLR